METSSFVFLGIDISKLTLDVHVDDLSLQKDIKINNHPTCIRKLFTKLQRTYPDQTILVCMEHTGSYGWHLFSVLADLKRIRAYVINPLHLKRSLGLRRGKTDKTDAREIARFLRMHFRELVPTILPRRLICDLQSLLANRNRLVKVLKQLQVPLKELALLKTSANAKTVSRISNPIIRLLKKQIHEVEKKIEMLINQDQRLHQLSLYIQSVTGVGPVTAWYLIVRTNEFQSISETRKLACFAGIAPFEHQSGTSINRRPRVSHMADKTLKSLLHLAALRAVRLKGELRDYYNRKVSEGKNKMLVLNAVRNKLVARICAAVNNQRLYQPVLTLS